MTQGLNAVQVLQLQHPRGLTRDTARYPPLMRYIPGGRPRPHALRWLAEHHLGLAIQGGAHSPIDDARAALYMYHMHRKVGPFASHSSEYELLCLFSL